ncbi:MAG: protein kinase, partial [Myxococcales bacterium]|nr:protein kinase [Myxococcales bacterium]
MTLPIQPGEILDGKYRVERKIGAGGMGAILEASHVALGERVAVKVMLTEMLGNAELVARFQREAQAAVRLRSEHSVRVRDVGTLPNGAPYIVMELLEGRDLATLLAERGPLPIDLAACYVLQACHAVAEAHAAGIIHRDLKPENLFLARRIDGADEVKVLDFGVAKTTDGPAASATQTASVFGSPQYMSPEQMRSTRDVDARSDVWSLGVCLYELVTGSLPFVAASVPELFAAVLREPPRSPVLLRPTLSPAMCAVILRSLEREPSARYANVADFADALAEAAGPSLVPLAARVRRVLEAGPRRSDPGLGALPSAPEPKSAPHVVAVTQPIAAPTVRDLPSFVPTEEPRARPLGWIVGGAVAVSLVVVLAVGVGLGLRARGAGPAISTDEGPTATAAPVTSSSAELAAKPAPTGIPDEIRPTASSAPTTAPAPPPPKRSAAP